MSEEKIPKEMLHTKVEARPRTRRIYKIIRIQKWEESFEKYKKTGSERIETAGDFFEYLKNDDDDDDGPSEAEKQIGLRFFNEAENTKLEPKA